MREIVESFPLLVAASASFDPSRTPQLFDFSKAQTAKLPGRDIERERSVTYALDLLHVVADFFEHFAELPVLTFSQRDLVPGIL